MGSVAVRPETAEEQLVRQKVAEVELPAGVRLSDVKLIDIPGIEDLMWNVSFLVSKSIPLTKKRVRELTDLNQRVSRKLIDAQVTYLPLITLLDAR